MGIKDINTFLKNRNVECFQQGNISQFSGKTIAIDSGILFMKSAARTHKGMIRNLKNAADNYNRREFFNNLMVDILLDIFFFIQNNCNVIVVFDGPKDPDKEECIEARRTVKETMREKISVALDEYQLCMENPLEYGLPDEYEKNLRNLRANDFHFDKSYIEDIKAIFVQLGIPFLQAPHDAEFICCSLVKNRKAHTVYTSDTDCYAFGINNIITNINMYNGNLDITNIRDIVRFFGQELEISKSEAKRSLRDFCIMCGCDFNKRIKGLGPVGSFKLIKEYKCFENIESRDLSSLKYDICLDKFTPYEIEIDEESLAVDIGKLLNEGDEIVERFCSDELRRSMNYIKRSNQNGIH